MIYEVRDDISLTKGSRFDPIYELADSSGSAIDLAGYALSGSLRRTYASTDYIDLNVSITDVSGGRFQLGIAASATAALNYAAGVYDIFIRQPDFRVYRLLYGVAAIKPEVTKWTSAQSL